MRKMRLITAGDIKSGRIAWDSAAYEDLTKTAQSTYRFLLSDIKIAVENDCFEDDAAVYTVCSKNCICDFLPLSKDQVSRAIRRLEKSGLIYVDRKDGMTNRYYLLTVEQMPEKEEQYGHLDPQIQEDLKYLDSLYDLEEWIEEYVEIFMRNVRWVLEDARNTLETSQKCMGECKELIKTMTRE